MQLTGAQILIEVLAEQGVDTVFGYPGGAVLNIYDELYKSQDRIFHCTTCHEQGAVHAADGYARVSGKPGVVIATSGPGATNLVTGIANAYLDSVPLVAITGNVEIAPVTVHVNGLQITMMNPAAQNSPAARSSEWTTFDTTQSDGIKISDLTDALDRLNVPAREKIRAIYAIHQAGALRARIVKE